MKKDDAYNYLFSVYNSLKDDDDKIIIEGNSN